MYYVVLLNRNMKLKSIFKKRHKNNQLVGPSVFLSYYLCVLLEKQLINLHQGVVSQNMNLNRLGSPPVEHFINPSDETTNPSDPPVNNLIKSVATMTNMDQR